jgi:predicted methyltransferase
VEFKTGEDSKIVLTIDGVEYSLRQPLVGDLRKLAKMQETNPSETIEIIISFISALGLPNEILDNMSVKTITDLFSFISGVKKN